MYDICLTVTAWCIIGLLGVLLIFSSEIVCADIGIRQVLHSFKRGILPLQKSTFPYICIANKGKCFCLAHYEVTIAKDTVSSQ